MTYSELIEQTRKELEKYSDTAKTLTDMYNKAKAAYEENYGISVEKLDDDYAVKKNAAAAQQKLDDKNTGEYLASRGLAFSGESAQAKLNSDMIYKNTLASLAGDHANSLSQLQQDKNSYLAKLDMDYAEKQLEAQKELTENALQLAQDKIKYGDAVIGDPAENEDVQTDGGNSAESDSASGGNTENNSASGNSSVKDSAVKDTTANKSESNTKTDETVSTESSFEPSMTAYQLANAIAKRYGSSDTVSLAEANINISKYLSGLKARYAFTDEYMDKVVFVLDALGYTPMDEKYIDIAVMVNNSANEYDIEYKSAEKLAKLLFNNYDDRKEYAEKRANIARLDYIYTRCSDMEEFYSACEMLELSSSRINEYLSNVEARKNKSTRVTLGENL